MENQTKIVIKGKMTSFSGDTGTKTHRILTATIVIPISENEEVEKLRLKMFKDITPSITLEVE